MKAEPILRKSGYEISGKHRLPHLHTHLYSIIDMEMSGAAPKDPIKAYIPGKCRKSKPESWPAYIAKVGHKRYPSESVTEQLLTRVGEVFGFRMAHSCLAIADNQIRFLSKVFTKNNEHLRHGVEIVALYLNDKEHRFIEEIIQEREERTQLTFQVIEAAINQLFPKQAEKILKGFVRMLAFDAITGNNDRHLTNWGVIIEPFGKREPRFSPIYDTARACFWQQPEDRLIKVLGNHAMLSAYIQKAAPLIGFEGREVHNHYDLIRQIRDHYPIYQSLLRHLYQPNKLDQLHEVIKREFSQLMTETRRNLIFHCLALRLEEYGKIVL